MYSIISALVGMHLLYMCGTITRSVKPHKYIWRPDKSCPHILPGSVSSYWEWQTWLPQTVKEEEGGSRQSDRKVQTVVLNSKTAWYLPSNADSRAVTFGHTAGVGLVHALLLWSSQLQLSPSEPMVPFAYATFCFAAFIKQCKATQYPSVCSASKGTSCYSKARSVEQQ